MRRRPKLAKLRSNGRPRPLEAGQCWSCQPFLPLSGESEGLADQVGQRNEQERANRAVSPYRMIVLTRATSYFLPRCIVRPQRKVEPGKPGEARAALGGTRRRPPSVAGRCPAVRPGMQAPWRLAGTAEFSGNGGCAVSRCVSHRCCVVHGGQKFLLTGTFFPTARSSRRSKVCVRAFRPFPLFAGRFCLSPYARRHRVSQSLSTKDTRYCYLQGFYGPGRSRTSARRFEVCRSIH